MYKIKYEIDRIIWAEKNCYIRKMPNCEVSVKPKHMHFFKFISSVSSLPTPPVGGIMALSIYISI